MSGPVAHVEVLRYPSEETAACRHALSDVVAVLCRGETGGHNRAGSICGQWARASFSPESRREAIPAPSGARCLPGQPFT